MQRKVNGSHVYNSLKKGACGRCPWCEWRREYLRFKDEREKQFAVDISRRLSA